MKSEGVERIWPDVAIPPGEHLADTLRELGITQSELARRMGRPQPAINEIIRGRKVITPETALQLERVTGVPGHVWVRLEADYRYNLARLAARRAPVRPAPRPAAAAQAAKARRASRR